MKSGYISKRTECQNNNQSRHHRFLKAIDGLPSQFRVVALWVGVEEYTVRDIARHLNLPEGTVKARLHRARRMLKHLLQ
jgi:RNA polymerase sigma-70 factor (ECF subfamily)